MEINKNILKPNLIFNTPVKINENIVISPVKMKDILSFQKCQNSLTIQKNAIFVEIDLIKMDYFQFLKHTYNNFELAEKYDQPLLPYYYTFFLELLSIVCIGAEIKWNPETLDILINNEVIDSHMFECIRRIVLIQNDVDFDPDEFIHMDTLKALEKAKAFEMKKRKESADIEDYIDSVVVGLSVSEEYVANITIRKFWRYVKRIQKHEEYRSYRSAELSGMVTFKEPLSHWMTTIEVEDKYDNLKVNEEELKEKMG